MNGMILGYTRLAPHIPIDVASLSNPSKVRKPKIIKGCNIHTLQGLVTDLSPTNSICHVACWLEKVLQHNHRQSNKLVQLESFVIAYRWVTVDAVDWRTQRRQNCCAKSR